MSRHVLLDKAPVWRDILFLEADMSDLTDSFRRFLEQNTQDNQPVKSKPPKSKRKPQKRQPRRIALPPRKGTDPGHYLDGNTNKQKEMAYSRYLLTGHWRRARAAAIKQAGGKCTVCQSTRRLHVHHLHYKTIWNERANDVVVLCEHCHNQLHKQERQ